MISGDVERGVRFHEATSLEAPDAETLARTVQLRVLRWFARRGLLDPSTAADMCTWQGTGGFASHLRCSVSSTAVDGSVRIEGEDRAGLERLVRYCARGPFALERLQANLAAIGAEYDVAVRQVNTRLALPILFPSGPMLVGLEQSDAILVRRGIEVANAMGRTYAAFPPPEFTTGFAIRRGWTQVDARLGGGWLRFVNTHLEIQPFAPIQAAQVAELIGHLVESPHPVILVGDFNSVAGRNAPAESKTDSYGMLMDAGFHDLWLPQDGISNNSGLTCCQASDLSSRASDLDQRLDLILARDIQYWQGIRRAAVDVEVFGDRPPDRFQTPEGYQLWPSDHAGVAARLFIATPQGLPGSC